MRARYLKRFRWGVIGLILLAIPATVHSHAAIETLLNRPYDWLPTSFAARSEFDAFADRFAATDVLLVAWPGAELGSDSLDAASQFLQPLCEQTDRDDVAAAEERIGRIAAIEHIRDLCDDRTPLSWTRTGTETLRRIIGPPTNLPREVGIRRLSAALVGPDGEQSCLAISLAKSGMRHRRALIPALRRELSRIGDVAPGDVAMVGAPVEGAAVDAASIRSVRFFTPPSALLAAVVCYLCLRSLSLTLAITSVAVIGEGLVLALVYYTGTPMNAVLIVLPPLVFVLTVSAAFTWSNYYLDALADADDGVVGGGHRRALSAGVTPCLLASGTTVIGLGSLTLVRLEPVRVFGAVAAAGVILTLGLLLLVLPGAMVIARPGRRRDSRREMNRAGCPPPRCGG